MRARPLGYGEIAAIVLSDLFGGTVVWDDASCEPDKECVQRRRQSYQEQGVFRTEFVQRKNRNKKMTADRQCDESQCH